MTTLIFKSFEEFQQREDESVNGVSQVFADSHPKFEADNETNKGCMGCTYCMDRMGCMDCKDVVG